MEIAEIDELKTTSGEMVEITIHRERIRAFLSGSNLENAVAVINHIVTVLSADVAFMKKDY